MPYGLKIQQFHIISECVHNGNMFYAKESPLCVRCILFSAILLTFTLKYVIITAVFQNTRQFVCAILSLNKTRAVERFVCSCPHCGQEHLCF